MKRKIKNSDHGVVGIVVAVLIIGLMVSVVSLIQLIYVPKWMEQKEAEHMDEVVTQFSNLKFAIDTHVSNKKPDTPIATSFTLGSKELPYLMSVRSYGTLKIIDSDPDPNISPFTITIDNVTKSDSYNIGIIKYSSSNAYFIDQSFIYEAGAIITSQDDGDMLSVKPSFSILNTSNNVTLFINLTTIASIGGKTIGSGYGTTAIQTEYSGNYSEDPINGVTAITINTQYPNSWSIYLDWLLKKVYHPSDYTITTNADQVNIGFTYISASFIPPDIDLEISEINAQIGAGWIE